MLAAVALGVAGPTPGSGIEGDVSLLGGLYFFSIPAVRIEGGVGFDVGAVRLGVEVPVGVVVEPRPSYLSGFLLRVGIVQPCFLIFAEGGPIVGWSPGTFSVDVGVVGQATLGGRLRIARSLCAELRPLELAFSGRSNGPVGFALSSWAGLTATF